MTLERDNVASGGGDFRDRLGDILGALVAGAPPVFVHTLDGSVKQVEAYGRGPGGWEFLEQGTREPIAVDVVRSAWVQPRPEDEAPVDEEADYWAGYDAGAADANMLQQPHNRNGYTEAVYCQIRARAEHHYYAFRPTPYQRGYCDGCDAVALCIRGDGGPVSLAVAGGAVGA